MLESRVGRVIPVLAHDVGGAYPELAHGAGRHVLALLALLALMALLAVGCCAVACCASAQRICIHINQPCFDVQTRPARAACALNRVFALEVDRHWAGFGCAVNLAHGNAPRMEGRNLRCRNGGRTGIQQPERRQVGIHKIWVLNHGAQRGRHQHRHAGAARLHIGQPGTGVKAGVQRNHGARIQGRQGLDAQAAHVEQRQRGEHLVRAGERMRVARDDAVRHQPGLRVQRAFGFAGGAQGVDQQHGGGAGACKLAGIKSAWHAASRRE